MPVAEPSRPLRRRACTRPAATDERREAVELGCCGSSARAGHGSAAPLVVELGIGPLLGVIDPPRRRQPLDPAESVPGTGLTAPSLSASTSPMSASRGARRTEGEEDPEHPRLDRPSHQTQSAGIYGHDWRHGKPLRSLQRREHALPALGIGAVRRVEADALDEVAVAASAARARCCSGSPTTAKVLRISSSMRSPISTHLPCFDSAFSSSCRPPQPWSSSTRL